MIEYEAGQLDQHSETVVFQFHLLSLLASFIAFMCTVLLLGICVRCRNCDRRKDRLQPPTQVINTIPVDIPVIFNPHSGAEELPRVGSGVVNLAFDISDDSCTNDLILGNPCLETEPDSKPPTKKELKRSSKKLESLDLNNIAFKNIYVY